ncbi:winged helix-turn-helix transcriptional regulator [Kitasatospora sp. NPDC101235]|uniref:winged helix-turn-helix transcriptional regulator n=1 Tax=Kitasatospora sp. NPDC101235 TaxID=3364101 RepID=UPI0037F714A6
MLLSLYNEETGAAEISQREMAAALGTAVPAVNRAVQQLRETGLAWQIEGGRYQLHPLLTGGAVASPATAVPEIKAVEPAAFTEQRRERYTAQIANLGQLPTSA